MPGAGGLPSDWSGSNSPGGAAGSVYCPEGGGSDGKEILSLPFSMARDLAVRQAAWRRAAAMVRQVLDRGQDVAMVVLGDVSIYSTYCYLMELLREEGYETEMIPGVASFSAVAAGWVSV